MEFDHVEVSGGRLRIARFGNGPRLAIAVHGISGSLMGWGGIAAALPQDEWTLVAVDLRGRGHSAGVPGPYGLDRHAEDLLRVADHVGAGSGAVLTGHSMGAYIATLVAAQRDFARVVLVDGGVPLPAPPDDQVDLVLKTTLGPAVDRLSMTFPSVEGYLDFFRAHPALGPYWNSAIEDYVRYDAGGGDGAVRSRVAEEAVWADGRWLLTGGERFGTALSRARSPIHLLRAPRGLLDQPQPFQSEAATAEWTARIPQLSAELVPDCNHYTIVFDPRAAAVVAARLVETVE